MGGYAVQLLGPPEVRQDGLPLALRSRKALALLAYLTLEARPCARETLAGLLWPDSEQDVARSALRTTVSQLRGLLGERLAVTKQTVALTWAEGDDLDLRRLQAGEPDAWRGDMLEGMQLDSEGFEHWLTGQRERVRGQADRAFEQRSAELLKTDPLGAAEMATRWLSLDRLNEAAWRRLILARVATGQRGLARETFETCRAVLASELNVSPAPETLALQARLHAEVDPLPLPVDLPAFLVGGPLVGRQDEFAQMVETYRLAASGVPQVLLISGEPGIGKTRLAGELLAWARERGAPLLRGRALEGPSAPFAPLVEALRRELEGLRAKLGPSQLSDLARLLPEVHDGPPPDPTGDPRAQVLGALNTACLALTPAGDTLDPLVLLIDDVQWADTSTQNALLSLAAQSGEGPCPLLLLFTARAEYLGTGSPLSGWLAKVRRHLPLQTLALTPLDVGGTEHLLARSVPRLSGSVQARLTAWLYARTAGHPLYLTETVKSLLESGALHRGELDETRLPHDAQGVRAAIGERLARLTPASLALAQGAAVLGQGSSFDALRSVADLDERTALTGYEELLSTGLLLEHGTLAQLSHDRVRETLRDALSAPRRRLLHGRAFQALKERQAPPAVLANHALDGGLTDEAATWFERAADAAYEVGAHAERVSASEMALRLIPKEREYHLKRYHLLVFIFQGVANRKGGGQQAALDYLDAHLESLPSSLREERMLCRAYRARRLSDMGRNAEALTVLDELSRESMTFGGSDVARIVYTVHAEVNINSWNWDSAENAIEKYEALVRDSHQDYFVVHCEALKLLVEANRRGYRDVFERQTELVMLSVEICKKAGFSKLWLVHIALLNIIQMYTGALCLGEIETALNIINWIEEETKGFEIETYLHGYIGFMLTAAGDYATALPYLRPIQAEKSKYGQDITIYTSSVAKCLAHLGHVEEATSILDDLSTVSSQTGSRNIFAVTSCIMADAHYALSNFERSLSHYQSGLLAYAPGVVLSSLRGVAQLLNTEDRQLSAYCLGAVLAGKVTRRHDRQQAEATLAKLRAHTPGQEIETALTEGETSALGEVVERVRTALSRRPVPVPTL